MASEQVRSHGFRENPIKMDRSTDEQSRPEGMLFPEHQGGKTEGAISHWKKQSSGGKLGVRIDGEESLRTPRPTQRMNGQVVWQKS
jgi:hypothetical protein